MKTIFEFKITYSEYNSVPWEYEFRRRPRSVISSNSRRFACKLL